MLYRILFFASAFAILLAGCGEDSKDQGQESLERGQIEKSDLVGSCIESDCASQAQDGTCWCDDECEEFDDCCEDYDKECNGTVDRDDLCPSIRGCG
jgi:hypothetical protein